MRKDNGVYLRQILEYIEDIDGYFEGISFKEFESDGLLQDGVIRKIELIGEAARRLTGAFWDKYGGKLPLAKAVSMRNRLIHEYEEIDLKIVWNTVKDDLPELRKKVGELI